MTFRSIPIMGVIEFELQVQDKFEVTSILTNEQQLFF